MTENCRTGFQYVGRDSGHSQRLLFITCIIDIIAFFSLNGHRATHTRPVILFYL